MWTRFLPCGNQLKWYNNSTEALHEERQPCPFPWCHSQILLSVRGYHKELYFMKVLRVWSRVLVCIGMKQIPLNLGGRRKKKEESERFLPEISVISFAILSTNSSFSLSGHTFRHRMCSVSHVSCYHHWKLGSEDRYQKLESKYQLLLSSYSNQEVYSDFFIFKGEGKKSCFLCKKTLTSQVLFLAWDAKVAMCHSSPAGRGAVTLIHKSPWYIHSAAKEKNGEYRVMAVRGGKYNFPAPLEAAWVILQGFAAAPNSLLYFCFPWQKHVLSLNEQHSFLLALLGALQLSQSSNLF